jgi:hypothetical protein
MCRLQSVDHPFTEGEIFIPLMREEAVADKETLTREVVHAGLEKLPQVAANRSRRLHRNMLLVCRL